MINHAVARILLAGGVAGGVLFSELAAAIDWNFTGLFRQEIAYSIASNNNEMNSMGSVFNDDAKAFRFNQQGVNTEQHIALLGHEMRLEPFDPEQVVLGNTVKAKSMGMGGMVVSR